MVASGVPILADTGAIDLKVQLASDNSGEYVPVVALDPSAVTLSVGPVTIDSGSITLAVGSSAIGGVFSAPTPLGSFAITPASSTTLESAHVLKASAGNLYSLYVMTTSADGYLMTFDATSIPADGAVSPRECIPVFAGNVVSINFAGAPPDHYSNGIVVVFSSTGPFTKTSSATAFFKWRVQ